VRSNPNAPRYFGHFDVTMDGVRYEVHPGPRSSINIVYRRFGRGRRQSLRRVKDRATIERVAETLKKQRQKPIETAAKARQATAARKPTPIKRASLRWRFVQWWRRVVVARFKT
jgi:hypothetical protein